MSLQFWKRAIPVLALVVVAGRADASLLPTAATDNSNNDGTVRFTYGVVLTSDSTLKSGDFFTIYDFQGYKPNTNAQPAGWTFSVANTGGTPPGITVTDNASLPNLTWTYSGPTLTGQLGLGNFSVISTNQQSQQATAFAGLSQRQVDGQNDSNITNTLVPGSTPAPPPSVPEPTTLALMGIGLPAAALYRHLRRARS